MKIKEMRKWRIKNYLRLSGNYLEGKKFIFLELNSLLTSSKKAMLKQNSKDAEAQIIWSLSLI